MDYRTFRSLQVHSLLINWLALPSPAIDWRLTGWIAKTFPDLTCQTVRPVIRSRPREFTKLVEEREIEWRFSNQAHVSGSLYIRFRGLGSHCIGFDIFRMDLIVCIEGENCVPLLFLAVLGQKLGGKKMELGGTLRQSSKYRPLENLIHPSILPRMWHFFLHVCRFTSFYGTFNLLGILWHNIF